MVQNETYSTPLCSNCSLETSGRGRAVLRQLFHAAANFKCKKASERRSGMVRVSMVIFLLLLGAHSLGQVTTAFTYQGELERNDVAADGNFDFRFQLYDMADGGIPLVSPADSANVLVTAGLFTAEVDFGFNVFGMTDLWLEVQVRDTNDGGGYTSLLPRQKITPAPIATHAMNVEEGAIGSEQIADGAVGADQIDASAVQLRISSSCTRGSFIRSIGLDGTVTCDPDEGLVTVTSADIEDGTIGAADLGANAVGAAAIDNSQVQARITGDCSTTQAIRGVNENGTVACAGIPQGDIAGITASTGSGLDGGCTTGTCNLSVDPTDFNGSNPVGFGFNEFIVVGETWTTITSFQISTGTAPGEILLIGKTESNCLDCKPPNDLAQCEIGFTNSPSGNPISALASRSIVGFRNGVLQFKNMTNVSPFSQPENTTQIYYLRGRTVMTGANNQCVFQRAAAGGVKVSE